MIHIIIAFFQQLQSRTCEVDILNEKILNEVVCNFYELSKMNIQVIWMCLQVKKEAAI